VTDRSSITWYRPFRSTATNLAIVLAPVGIGTIFALGVVVTNIATRSSHALGDETRSIAPDPTRAAPGNTSTLQREQNEQLTPPQALVVEDRALEPEPVHLPPPRSRKPRFLAAGWGMNGRNTTSWPPSVTVASATEVQSEFGIVSYGVSCPPDRRTSESLFERDSPTARRGIQVTLGRPTTRYDDLALLSFVLDRALEHAWEECVIINGISGEPDQRVGWASIVGSTPNDHRERELARAERFVLSTWGEIEALEGGR